MPAIVSSSLDPLRIRVLRPSSFRYRRMISRMMMMIRVPRPMYMVALRCGSR
jgi:hypothetical protein